MSANTGENHSDGSPSVVVYIVVVGTTSSMLIAVKLRCGQFDQQWLLQASITEMEWLRDGRGNPYKIAHALVPVQSNSLNDIVHWRWEKYGVSRFFPVHDKTHALTVRGESLHRYAWR